MPNSKNTNLHLAKPQDETEKKRKIKRYRKYKIRQWAIIGGILVLILTGTYLMLTTRQYAKVSEVKSYTNAGADNNAYQQFGEGVIRYSNDGIVFLNTGNVEIWNQPYQIKKPIIAMNEEAFVVADSGGNSIMVFTEEGLKGEMSTTLPIEKIAVSNQGIVSAILKNENKPQIISYDAAGNILVEQQVDTSVVGYPVSLALSPDGTLLEVSYLYTQTGVMTSKIIYYNFGTVGQGKTDNQVTADEYVNTIMPTTFFMDDTTSVVVGDRSFVIYQGTQIPEMKQTIALKKEIKSTFHTDKYVGFVLKDPDTAEYELRIYNQSGREVMSAGFTGEYSNIKMVGNEVIMYEGQKSCIYTTSGIQRFKGTLPVNALEVMPVFGINKYLVISADEAKVVRLVK